MKNNAGVLWVLKWSGLILGQILCGVLVLVFPLYEVVGFSLFICLSVAACLAHKWALYLLLVFVYVLQDFAGFMVHVPGITDRNLIPFYFPYLIVIASSFFIIRSMKPASEQNGPKLMNSMNIPIVVLLAYIALSLIWIRPFSYHLVMFFTFGLNMIIFYLFFHSVAEETFHQKLMYLWVFLGIFLSFVTLGSFWQESIETEHEIFPWLSLNFYMEQTMPDRANAFAHPNNSSLTLNLASFVTFGLFLFETIKVKKWFFFLSLCFIIFANFTTQSKAGFGSFFLMSNALIVFSSKLRGKKIRSVVFFNLLLIVIVLCSNLFIMGVEGKSQRYLKVSGTGGSENSLSLRVEKWEAGLREMKKGMRMITGLGIGGYTYETEIVHPHSIYLAFFYDFGLVGILFLSGTGITLLRNFGMIEMGKQILYTQETYLQIMSLAFFCGLGAIAIHGTIDITYFRGTLWMFLGLAMTTFRMTRLELLKTRGKIKNDTSG